MDKSFIIIVRKSYHARIPFNGTENTGSCLNFSFEKILLAQLSAEVVAASISIAG
jgi:hypothetical protein